MLVVAKQAKRLRKMHAVFSKALNIETPSDSLESYRYQLPIWLKALLKESYYTSL